MPDQVRINTDVWKRVATATRTVEGMCRNNPLDGGSVSPLPPVGLWAEITDVDRGSGKCSWQALQYTTDGCSVNTDWGQGDNGNDDGWAMESYHSCSVLTNSQVFLRPAMGDNIYVFEYSPGVTLATLNGDIAAGSQGTVTVGSDTDLQVVSDMGAVKAADGQVYITYDQTQQQWRVTGQQCNTSTDDGGDDGGDEGDDATPAHVASFLKPHQINVDPITNGMYEDGFVKMDSHALDSPTWIAQRATMGNDKPILKMKYHKLTLSTQQWATLVGVPEQTLWERIAQRLSVKEVLGQ
jgi:hypothetical protein